jgi:SAM-dependent methyltransferase
LTPERTTHNVEPTSPADDATGTTTATVAASNGGALRAASKVELFRLFLSERHDPEPFYTKLADRSVAEFPFPLQGRLVLDCGAGPGHYTAALQRNGATVVPIDLGADNTSKAGAAGLAAVRTDAMSLPFPERSFDGVFCSNMLEHVPEASRVIDEIERVLKPGGWGWISWTNWFSPWGGHDITPWHLLGTRLGPRVHERVHGGPPERNAVYKGLWPTYIGRTLDDVRGRANLRLIDAVPRYYPSQKWVLKVPGLREVATWNCLILVERRPDAGPPETSPAGAPRSAAPASTRLRP